MALRETRRHLDLHTSVRCFSRSIHSMYKVLYTTDLSPSHSSSRPWSESKPQTIRYDIWRLPFGARIGHRPNQQINRRSLCGILQTQMLQMLQMYASPRHVQPRLFSDMMGALIPCSRTLRPLLLPALFLLPLPPLRAAELRFDPRPLAPDMK